MASLTKEDEKFIDKHPLKVDYDAFGATFEDSSIAKAHASPERKDLLSRRDVISNLLATLQVSPVARRLKSLQQPVNGQLATIYARAQSETFDLSPFTTLTKLVAERASDLDIWRVVLQLIADLSRVTPPRSSIPPSFSGTPLRRSSASFRDSNQKRNDLYDQVLIELSGRTYTDVPKFVDKYFEHKPWSSQVEDILRELPENDPLSNFPETLQPEEDDVWAWVELFQNTHLSDAPNKYYRTRTKKELTGAPGDRQLDIFLKPHSVASDGVHDWKDCLVVGELTKSDIGKRSKEKFVQLATYVRNVFFAQPIRRFVHAFLVFGVQMQLWVFDRSGAYSCSSFNIRQEPQQFIRVLAGYAWMTAQELGLDTFVQWAAPYPSVTLPDPATGKNHQFELEPSPFFQQPAIVCRGTTCYRTTDGKHVVKFSWRPDKQRSEVDHLTKAKGVRGVPTLVGASTIATISELRGDLQIRKLRNLGHTVHEKNADASQLSFTSQSAQQLESLNVSGSKRKTNQRDESPPKRSRPNSQRSSLHREVQPVALEQPPMSTMPPPTSPQRNRVLTCIAIAPAGGPLEQFAGVREVLGAFRDAIKAHKTLFMERKILHRDVSHGNIILTDPEQNRGCSGMLIDYDLAVQVGGDGKNETSAEKNMTGTLEFIAIEILESAMRKDKAGIERTYRHDLESFFYVFLALCIRHGRETGARPEPDVLRSWYDGGYGHIAQAKRGAMSGFEIYLLDNFSATFDCVKELARKLRDILFGKGELNLETPTKPDTLYEPMIAAFEDAIQILDW